MGQFALLHVAYAYDIAIYRAQIYIFCIIYTSMAPMHADSSCMYFINAALQPCMHGHAYYKAIYAELYI